MMLEWNEFSAFEDLPELEHVVDLLRDWAAASTYVQRLEPPNNRYDFETGEKSTLWKRLDRQASKTEAEIEEERPGIYQKTYIAHIFNRLFLVLGDIAERPSMLASKLTDISILLHQVLICAHEVFDEKRRQQLVDKTSKEVEEKTKENFVRIQQKQKSDASRNSHIGRKQTRDYVIQQFFHKQEVWDSIAEAAESIKQSAIEYSRNFPRPLTPTNASKTIAMWISEHIKENPDAKRKLSEKAKSRLRSDQ